MIRLRLRFDLTAIAFRTEVVYDSSYSCSCVRFVFNRRRPSSSLSVYWIGYCLVDIVMVYVCICGVLNVSVIS